MVMVDGDSGRGAGAAAHGDRFAVTEAGPRHRRYWTAAEDRRLLAYEPGRGQTLHDLARELGRTYYACRIRRKALRSGALEPGQRYPCAMCGRTLPKGRKQGYCGRCRTRVDAGRYQRRYERERAATRPEARRRWRRWTAQEDDVLIEQGANIRTAKELGRTLSSCLARVARLQQGAA